MSRTGLRSWSRSTVAPVVPGRRPSSPETSLSAPARAGCGRWGADRLVRRRHRGQRLGSRPGHRHVGTKALGREGNPEKGYGGIAGAKAVLGNLNEYHGFVTIPAGEHRPTVGTVVPVIPNHVCPVVVNFEELIVTDSAGTSLQWWPVDARGFLA